jgi:NAD(P)-dependent dehydrogenase (short-subunit alcohol dehydrogenase family)
MKVYALNTTAALYTVKLGLHHFRRQYAQNPEASQDQLLVLQSSVAGYLDIPSSLCYTVSKFGMRAVMRSLRWTEHRHGIRVNSICPW